MVNVIIPVFHSKSTLPRTLDSLVSQTRKQFITTICQDGDEEDYSEIIEEYSKRGLNIKLLVSKENKGPGAARQMGIDDNTMCDYLMFLDSDDMLTPRAVELLYREAKANQYDFCTSDFIAESKVNNSSYISCENAPVTWVLGKIYRTDFLKENNIRFEDDIRLNEDSYFNLVVANTAKKMGRIPEYTGIMCENPNSLTRESGSIGFFKNSAGQYVKSQARGVRRILEINEGNMNPQVAGISVLNMYNHMMRMEYFKISTKETLKDLNDLKNCKYFKDMLNNSQFWDVIVRNLRGCDLFNEQLYFFKTDFGTWMNRYFK